jgi:mycothiol synthase
MRVQLDGRTIPPAVWPDGVVLHTYGLRWSRPMREAHNAAFADHWGFVDWTAERWQQWVDGSRNFRPDLSWVLVDDADPAVVVAYIQTNEYDAYAEATGRKEAHVGNIGVRREHRGRGLASNLLRHALRAYQAAGFDESALGVDTNNPTGAFGLYERAGYEVERRIATFRRLLPPMDQQSSTTS